MANKKTKKRNKVEKEESTSDDKRKRRRKTKEKEVKDELAENKVDVLPKETEVISVSEINWNDNSGGEIEASLIQFF